MRRWYAPPKIKGNGKRALCRGVHAKRCAWVLVAVAAACAGLALVWHEELPPLLQHWTFASSSAAVSSSAPLLPHTLSSSSAPAGRHADISPASLPSASASSSVSPQQALPAAQAARAAAALSPIIEQDNTISSISDAEPAEQAMEGGEKDEVMDQEEEEEIVEEEEEIVEEEEAAAAAAAAAADGSLADGPALQEREDEAAEAEMEDDDDSHDLFSEGLDDAELEWEGQEEEEEMMEEAEEDEEEDEDEEEEEEEEMTNEGEMEEEEQEGDQDQEQQDEDKGVIMDSEKDEEALRPAAKEEMMELERDEETTASPGSSSTGPPQAKSARNRRNERSRTRRGASDAENAVDCDARYGTRHFLREEQQAEPPVLYSFPGSGNTWTRLLVDFATGIYSGTIISQAKSGDKPLPGQGHCHRRVSVVKAHPHHYSPSELFAIPDNDDPYLPRCRRLGRIEGFNRFILLTRNPYDAIWSEYRRTTSPVILRHSFNRTGFAHTARMLADRYQEMVVAFREVRRALPKEAVVNLKYEDLLDKDARLSIVLRLVDFIGINGGDDPKARRQRATCALELAERVGGGRRGSNLVKAMNGDEGANAVVTADEAYTPEVACAMWAAFGAAAKEMGYTPPGGITERDCRAIGVF